MPPTAVLGGLLTLTIFAMSHATVSVPNTRWVEPVLAWVSIGMPVGSEQDSLYQYLWSLLDKTRKKSGAEKGPSWLMEGATFKRMGAMMEANHSKLLGLYDNLLTFLINLNLYDDGGFADSHELAQFIQLYNGHPWTRTGD